MTPSTDAMRIQRFGGPNKIATSKYASWWTVAVLFIFYMFSNIDRTVITMLVDPIRKDLDIGDLGMGLLLGPAFGLFFAACGLPMGIVVDRFNRRSVLYAGVTAWSAAATLCGFASSYVILFLGRAGVGVGEATLSPCAYSLIADLIPRKKLSTALSIYSSAVVVGSAIALVGSGWAIGLLRSGHLVFGLLKPWQALFVFTGVPGFLLALLSFTIGDPRVRAGDHIVNPVAKPVFLPYLLANKRLYGCLFVGVGLTVAVSYALLGWIPTYLMRVLHLTPSAAGTTFGLIVVLAGGPGQILSGLIVDHFTARGMKDAPLRYLMTVNVISLIPSCAAFLVHSQYLFVILISPFFFFTLPMMGYSAAAVQMVTPAELRGRASAAFLFTITILGVSLGTPTAGFLTDFIFRSAGHLGWSLCTVLAFLSPLAILTSWAGLAPLRSADRY